MKFIPILNGDRASGVVLTLIGAFLLRECLWLPFGTLNAPDAGFFPIILATLILVGGVTMVAYSFIYEPAILEFTRRSWGPVLCAVGFLLYAGLVDRIGFLICTTTFLLLLMKLYGQLSWRISVGTTLAIVLVTYFGFVELGVPLPRGILTLS